MSRIPRRYSHYIFGFIHSGLTCAVAAGIVAYFENVSGPF